MDFREMMNQRREYLLAQNKEIKNEQSRALAEIEEELRELQKEQADLKQQRASLGFFQMRKKRVLDELLQKFDTQKQALQFQKEHVSADAKAKIESNTRYLAIIDGKKGGVIEFGFAPYSDKREPLQWVILSCDDQKMRLICKNTVGVASYGRAVKWVCDEFLKEAFTAKERALIDAGVSVPTASEAGATGNMHALPTSALRAYVTKRAQEDGARYYYNNLQIQNSIKDALHRCEPYWLVTENLRDGFANYVGSSVSDGSWFAARIGAGAEFAIRPVITVDRFALVQDQ